MKSCTTKSYRKNEILIPEIQKKIKKKLKELNLIPQIWPKDFLEKYGVGKHRYFTLCFRGGEEILAFYARLHDNPDAKEKFKKEIRLFKNIEKSNLKKIAPKIFNFGIEKEFEWFEREYLPYPPLGQIEKPYLPLSSLIIDEITKTIFKISKISLKRFSKVRLKKFKVKDYLATPSFEDLLKKKVISKIFFQKIQNFIKDKLEILKKENRYFVHGDLNLSNILSDGKKIWLIDWELAHINNFAYDICYLWSHLWDTRRNLRNKLMTSYLKKLTPNQLVKFKKLLPVVASYLALGGIALRKKGERIKLLNKRKSFYIKLLKNCLKPFEILIKT